MYKYNWTFYVKLLFLKLWIDHLIDFNDYIVLHPRDLLVNSYLQ